MVRIGIGSVRAEVLARGPSVIVGGSQHCVEKFDGRVMRNQAVTVLTLGVTIQI